MATERFKEWVKETKEALATSAESEKVSTSEWLILKAIVYALLTIAIAIHEAAEVKGKK